MHATNLVLGVKSASRSDASSLGFVLGALEDGIEVDVS